MPKTQQDENHHYQKTNVRSAPEAAWSEFISKPSRLQQSNNPKLRLPNPMCSLAEGKGSEISVSLYPLLLSFNLLLFLIYFSNSSRVPGNALNCFQAQLHRNPKFLQGVAQTQPDQELRALLTASRFSSPDAQLLQGKLISCLWEAQL